MRKIFIIDTNVLIHDPYCIHNFFDNEVILPIFVIEEIDKLKRNPNTAIQARIATRVIENIRKRGSLYKGVDIENDIFFRVEIENDISLIPPSLSADEVDNKIISATLSIKKKNPDKRVIIVSKDINMRIKADALELEVQDYKTDRVEYSELYSGVLDVEINEEQFNAYKESGKIDVDSLNLNINKESIEPNCYFKLRYQDEILLGKYGNGNVKKIILGEGPVWGLSSRNEEQTFALDLLMNDNIKVVTLVGAAGTGKTLLAIASALEQVVERKKYRKVLIARPVMPMGKDLGYLPGSEKEKLRPWMQPIFDNIEFLSENKESKAGEKVILGLESMGLMKIEALTYIRGRNISNSFIIIDEAQNLTPLEIKTIITRVGKDSKIILTGDPTQIDSPFLDSNTNGLTYMVEKLKDEKMIGHITLIKGERSEVSEIASRLL